MTLRVPSMAILRRRMEFVVKIMAKSLFKKDQSILQEFEDKNSKTKNTTSILQVYIENLNDLMKSKALSYIGTLVL